MKRILYTVAFLLPLCLSCSKADIPAADGPELVDVVFKGQTTATKTYISGVEDDYVKFVWGNNDRIGIFQLDNLGNAVTDGQNLTGRISKTSSSGPGFKTANFSTRLPLEGDTHYLVRIYYPHHGVSGTADAIESCIPGIQYQHGAGASSHILYSGTFGYAGAAFTTPSEVSSYTPEIGFELSYKNSFVWLEISAADASAALWRLVSVRMQAPEGKLLSGNTRYVPSEDSFTVTSGTNAVELNIGGGYELSQTDKCNAYLVAAPCALAGSNVTFTYTLEKDGVYRYVTHTKQIGTSSEALHPGATHKFVEAIPSADTEGWVYSTPASFDLSAQGTANCYIAYTPGSYSFDATVIGNGQKGIMLPVATTFFHTDDAGIVPSSARLLWQTSPGLISDVAYSAGRISFTKAAGYGNALIAAYDADGETILWSWHIWCTEIGPAIENSGPYTNFMMMDRNLGASYASSDHVTDQELADRTLGMYYQWGRKDPFVGPAHLATNSEAATVYNADGTVFTGFTHVAKTSANGTQDWVLKNPTTFITVSNSAYDWFYGLGVEANGGPSTRGYYFWGNPNPNSYDAVIPGSIRKTVYDPCPAGWMIPQEDVWGGGLTWKSDSATGTVLSSAGGDSFYPQGNLIGYSTGEVSTGNVGKQGYYWSSGFGNATTSKTIWKMQISNTSKSNTTSWGNAYGFSVRCCQEY